MEQSYKGVSCENINLYVQYYACLKFYTYMYMQVYLGHVHIYTCIYVYMYMYKLNNQNTTVQKQKETERKQASMYMYTHTCTCTCTYIHENTNIKAQIFNNTCTHVHCVYYMYSESAEAGYLGCRCGEESTGPQSKGSLQTCQVHIHTVYTTHCLLRHTHTI